MNSVLVSGTLALDYIADVTAGFDPGNLNGKLSQPERHYGGCGMNLAYGLARAGQTALPWVSYGGDCPADYLAHLERLGIDTRAMDRQPAAGCATAFIFTRPDGAQLTGFYPGSTVYADPPAHWLEYFDGCAAWLAGPEPDATLISRVRIAPEHLPLWWMPGQYTEILETATLSTLLARTDVLVVNSAEWLVLQERVTHAELEALREVYVTCGADGVRFGPAFDLQHSAGVPVAVRDPTGCGDAFCARLAAGRLAGESMADAVTEAQESARRCLVRAGSQSY